MASQAMHPVDEVEKPSTTHIHHDEGKGLDSRTRSGEEGDNGSVEMAPMATPGAAWEKKTILKIDLRLLVIRGSMSPRAF